MILIFMQKKGCSCLHRMKQPCSVFTHTEELTAVEIVEEVLLKYSKFTLLTFLSSFLLVFGYFYTKKTLYERAGGTSQPRCYITALVTVISKDGVF